MTTTDQPASLISTLPGQYYTDPAVFALEQSRLFESSPRPPSPRPLPRVKI